MQLIATRPQQLLVSCTQAITTLLLIMTSTNSLPLPIILSIFQVDIHIICFFSCNCGCYSTPCRYPCRLPLLTAAEGCSCILPAGDTIAQVDLCLDLIICLDQNFLWLDGLPKHHGDNETKVFTAGCPS